MKSIEEIRDLLDIPLDMPEDERPEDLQIVSLTDPKYRACISYELKTGFHICYGPRDYE
jgi:hypothetical protein